ncbi:creatininase family protein [Paenibacillus alkalitolerans]|uniref:creatininase family protein n=1 Tax=Paenibacillus alkalitolerans TaxID=2799335 RepID=UPI0018F5D8CD|nr:creatininase family protein [Paenibacillus alkalitolerans]
MYLTRMRPEEIRQAVNNNVPALLAAGVVEYHGPHLPVGTDILIAESICEEVERRCGCVVAPSLPYGPTMMWAGGPEEGEIDFAPDPLFRYAKEMLRGLTAIGFKRVYILQHHAGPEGLQRLCLKRAAAEIMREETAGWGAGWGRTPKDAFPNPDIFHRIRVADLDDFSDYPEDSRERIPVGHAGKGETQLIMAAAPDTVDLQALACWKEELRPLWLRDASEATMEEGKRWFEFCVQGWVRELSGNG